MSSTKETYIGIDFGSSKVAVVAADFSEEKGLDIIGVGIKETSALKKGSIINVEDAISDLSAALEQAERMAGMKLDNAVVGIGDTHIHSLNSKGVVAISRADGEITEEDIERVIEASKAVSIPTNFEVIHVVPRQFTVDGQGDITDPVGMTGIRLEVDTHMIISSSPALKNLQRCIEQVDLGSHDIVFNALASGNLLLSQQDRELGVVVCDIGSATTEIAVFEGGHILHSKVFPVGSNHITNDLAIGLRTSLGLAEEIKLDHSDALPSSVDEHKRIDLKKYDPAEEQKVSKKFISEIVEARLVEIFGLIKDELKKIDKDGSLPAGAVLTGGGAKIPNICEVAKDTLKLSAREGEFQVKTSGLVDKLSDPIYTCSTALCLWGHTISRASGKRSFVKIPGVGNISGKIKGWLRHLIP